MTKLLDTLYSFDTYTEFDLTPAMRDELIYSKSEQARIDSMLQCSSYAPQPIRLGLRTLSRNTWKALIETWFQKIPDTPLSQWDRSYMSKWGAQGGPVPASDLKALIRSNYDNVVTNISPSSHTRALNYMLNRLRDVIAVQGYPQVSPYTGYSCERSGAPYQFRKDNWMAEGMAKFDYSRSAHWPAINIPGHRYQRNKPRAIYNDAFSNVYEIGGFLSAVRSYLRTFLPCYFASWRNPSEELAPRITAHLFKGTGFVLGDYVKMDQHFGWSTVQKWVLPVYEVLSPDKWEFDRFVSFVEGLYRQPIYMGSTAWCGLHNTLSGIPVTNDFETIFSALDALAALMAAGEDHECATIVVNGDDVNIGCKQPSLVLPHWIELSDAAGVPPSVEKTSISFTSQFCKMYRALNAGLAQMTNEMGRPYIAGAYPISLMSNSLCNPEYPLETIEENLVAVLQILDNGRGNPHWSSFVEWFWPHTSFASRKFSMTALENVEIRDWWDKVYGVKWNIANSTSFIYLLDRNRLAVSD